MISVKQTSEDETHYHFDVSIEEGDAETQHRVAAGKSYIAGLAPNAQAIDVIRWSFRFLLDREPKETILPEFDLSIIQSYFPEYEERARAHFARE